MSNGKPLKVVIIGNGIAGVSVASKLRQLEPDPDRLNVEIYTREPFEYYARIRLPELFHSQINALDLAIYKPHWYESRHIRVYKNQEVVRVEGASKKIVLRSGIEVPYDRLVLCMGADSVKPPIPKNDLDGIFTVREYGDADAIRSYMREGTRHAIVIGGGLLGLEAARQMYTPELESLTIIEIFPRLLPKQLDETGARLLKTIIERLPCTVLLGTRVVEFVGERSVEGLRLTDGRFLPAETVLISTGIRPRIELAREAGLDVKHGVVVDQFLRSSDPDIYVAGDLVEFEGIVWGIIPAALDHALVAANNLLGRGSVVYRQTIPQNTLKVAGLHLTSIGKVVFEGEKQDGYEIVSRLDEERERYEKYVTKEGRLVGSILLGSRDNLSFVTQRIGKEITAEEIRSRLW